MQYTLSDLEGDVIIVVPGKSQGVVPKVAVVFNDSEGDGEIVMLLDDRLVNDLTTAMKMSLQESERAG